MHRRWLLLFMVILVGCGRPLQGIATPRPIAQASPLIIATITLAATDQAAPSASPLSFPTPEPATTLTVPTAQAATQLPEVSTTLPASASPTPAVIVIPRTAVPETNEQRWRAQQAGREVLQPPQLYTTNRPAVLWWYDPQTGQALEIGTIIGDFPVQARFTLRSTNTAALEVPYRINGDFGLTAISDAIRDRMKNAGYTQSVEAYVVQADGIQPK